MNVQVTDDWTVVIQYCITLFCFAGPFIFSILTHWGILYLEQHTFMLRLVIYTATTWTNIDILSIEWTHTRRNTLIFIQEMILGMSSAKCQPFCSGLSVLNRKRGVFLICPGPIEKMFPADVIAPLGPRALFTYNTTSYRYISRSLKATSYV